MPDRVFHHHLLGAGAILEKHLQTIGNGAFVGLQILATEARLFDHFHLLAQPVDAGVRSVEPIFIVLGDQRAEDQRHRHHVLQAMVAVGRVGERTDLGNDADRRLLGSDHDTVDFMQAIAHLRMQGDRRLAGGLGMELGREADLEQHVLHHIAAQRLGQSQLALIGRLERQVLVGMAERNIVEPPLRCRQHAGYAHFATQGDIGQAHAPTGRITRCPGFARAGVGRVTICPQCLAIDEGMGQRREQLLTVGAHQLGTHRRGGDLDQQHMVQTDTVEGVLQRQHTLDLVGHDHGFEDFAHAQWRFTVGDALLREMIGYRQDATKVVGRVRPLSRQPGVVVVQPTHGAADVPGGLDRIQPVGGARHPRPMGNDGAFHQRPEVLGAFGETQGQQAATEGVDQAIACGIQRLGRLHLIGEDVVGKGLQHPVVARAVVQVHVGAHCQLL
ncbi:hypothetical protein D3C79_500050 [compost metagenome]